MSTPLEPAVPPEGGLKMSRWRPDTLRTGPSQEDRGFLGHPGGLPWMLNVEMWERFSYYGMRAILVYFITDTFANGGLGISDNTGAVIMAVYGAAVYLLAIPGGIVADRILGPWSSTLYGGVIIMAGHILLSVPATITAWLGMCLVAIGTGFIKPNLSTIVGGLYDDDDPRRDAGFMYFYMSINIGAFFSPFVTGWLRSQWGYHAGFAAAAVGMAFALVAFYYGRKKLTDFAYAIPNPLRPGDGKRLAIGSLVICVLAVGMFFAFKAIFGDVAAGLAYTVFAISTLATIAYFLVMFRSPKVTSNERTHLAAYIPLWIGGMLFFMIFEQASGKMALFASDNTNLMGGKIDPAWYQSVNPLAIVALAPLLGWFFTRRAGKFPNTATKFAFAVTLIGLSAIIMGWGYQMWPGGNKLAPFWFLGMVFVVQTVGELFLSPVGLSATTALAPKAFASQAMSLWLLTSAVGQGLAAVIIERTADISDSTYYYGLGIATIVVSVVLYVLAPWTQRRMADVGYHEDAH